MAFRWSAPAMSARSPTSSTPSWSARSREPRSPRFPAGRSRSARDCPSQVALVVVPGVLQRTEVRAEQARERLDAALTLGLLARVVAERRPVAAPAAVQEEVDQRPGGAIGEDSPVAAPERITRPGGDQVTQGDRPLLLYPLYVLEQGHARIELQPHLAGDDRPRPADLPGLDVQAPAHLGESEVGRQPLLEPLRCLSPGPVGPLVVEHVDRFVDD